MAGLQRVDPALYEAAEIDGAVWWRRFWHITLRRSGRRSTWSLLTCTIAALKVFGPIFVLTRGGPGKATIVPSYFATRTSSRRSTSATARRSPPCSALIIIVVGFLFLRAQQRSERAEAS